MILMSLRSFLRPYAYRFVDYLKEKQVWLQETNDHYKMLFKIEKKLFLGDKK